MSEQASVLALPKAHLVILDFRCERGEIALDTCKAIILGAGRPFRGEVPTAIAKPYGSHRVLDWQLTALRGVLDPEIHFVGGYRIEEITKAYPQILFSLNPEWSSTGSLGSLLAAPLAVDEETYVAYSDIVFSGDVVKSLRDTPGDVVIVVDRAWRSRYESRSEADIAIAEKVLTTSGVLQDIGSTLPAEQANGEFIGLMKLSPAAVARLTDLRKLDRKKWSTGTIPDLIKHFMADGMTVRSVEIQGDWAELNAPQDLARFVLGTKAETLERLRTVVRHSTIGDQVRFTVQEWAQNGEHVLQDIQDKFGSHLLIVRSSAITEDNWHTSNAGGFDSVLHVNGADRPCIKDAINRVISSYGDGNGAHQVLVQRMLTAVSASGVVFTRTLTHGAPYYVMNYDDSTRSTDSVTSGSGQDLRTVVISRTVNTDEPQPPLSDLLLAVKEVEVLVGHDSLDIEFAITDDGTVHILQVRPIAVNFGSSSVSDEQIGLTLDNARNTFQQLQSPSFPLVGGYTYFGVMPDWNPAEIIGTKPKRLALTLYEDLVTNEVWAQQRFEAGYRDVRLQPLIVAFAGQPYVDLRVDFNSWVPAELSEQLAEKLVNHYLDRLKANPHWHDKIEFEVAFTCVSFDFDGQAQRLVESGFSDHEISLLRGGLTKITRGMMDRVEGDLEQVEHLQERFRRIMATTKDPVNRAYLLLEDCKRYGTLPFAHLARAGFVAITLLRSLEAIGVTSAEDTTRFLNSVETVTSVFEQQGALVAAGRMSWDDFVAEYGHLRPGTYEVTSPSYSEEPERYLRPMVRTRTISADKPSTSAWDDTTRTKIAQALRAASLPDNVERFETFLRSAIEGREYSKFIFTRNLSAALDALVEVGNRHGLSRDQISYLALSDLMALRNCAPATDVSAWLKKRVEEGQAQHRTTQEVELPALLIADRDFVCFERSASQPNFITAGEVVAESVVLSGTSTQTPDIRGKIVLIPAADPGYDWLFGHSIAGLITMYGGANSHMAIRAAEFGLPAAIGVGENLFETLARAEVLELDCRAQRIQAVR